MRKLQLATIWVFENPIQCQWKETLSAIFKRACECVTQMECEINSESLSWLKIQAGARAELESIPEHNKVTQHHSYQLQSPSRSNAEVKPPNFT